MKTNKNLIMVTIVSSCFMFLLSAFVNEVRAHDEYLNYTFTDFNPYEVDNDDQDPFKGHLTLTVTNDTDEAWGNFHFYIFGIPGVDYSGGPTTGIDTIFVDGNCGWGSPNCNPTKTPGSLDSWSIYNNAKSLDLFYFTNPVGVNQTVTFEVYTDNTGDKKRFGIGFYPSVVPEPISSILFITGGTLLAGRRFLRRKA